MISAIRECRLDGLDVIAEAGRFHDSVVCASLAMSLRFVRADRFDHDDFISGRVENLNYICSRLRQSANRTS